MARNQMVKALRERAEVAVLIIGGGVNGIATFRDLALQGVDVLLVERDDFCSGTSSASSHMVHGGIRYLENGEFRLVREAVQERNRLLQNCPQYVKPLATTIPIFNWFSGLANAPLKFLGWLDKPSERGAVVIKLGLLMYDAYTRRQGTVPKHGFSGRDTALTQFPQLNPHILCTATYYDAAMPAPERICIEMMLDGQAAGGRALNYVSAVSAEGETVWLKDEITGQQVAIQPQIVINAGGPWIDFVNEAMGEPTRFIGGTKGSHLVLDHPQLRRAIGESEFFFENKDGRIVLIYPFLDKVLVGTSDLRVENADEARCTEEEVDYFLAMVKRVFPAIEVNEADIVFRFAGVRPLPAGDANTTGQISRDHNNRLLEPANLTFPIYNLIGGKWTTHRAFAEQVTDTVLARLDQPRQTSTRNLPIGGGRNYPHTGGGKTQWLERVQARTGLNKTRLLVLFERYGTRAEAVANFIVDATDTPLHHLPSYSRREILFLAQEEQVVRLVDLLLRRTLLGILGQVTYELVVELVEILGEMGDGFPAGDPTNEISHTLAYLADKHSLNLTPITSQ